MGFCHAESLGQKLYTELVGRVIDRRCGEAEPEFVSLNAADLIARSTGLNVNGENHPISGFSYLETACVAVILH